MSLSPADPPSRSHPAAPLLVRAVALDFDRKVDEDIAVQVVRATIDAGRFVWIDLEWSDADEARSGLAALGLVSDDLIDEALGHEPATQVARFDDYLHMALAACRPTADSFRLDRVDAVLAERFLVTVHRGPSPLIDAVRRQYHADFVRFAKSPSFLVYELWDCLIEGYHAAQHRLEGRVERLQGELIDDVDEQVFRVASALGGDLLHLRKVVQPARAALTDLATRKSLFLTEATQGFLGNMVGSLERVLQDVLVARDILAQSLNLSMSMVAHRTNRVMSRLTVVSMIFLPLTFLCGVYGMNFEVLPELKWRYGYAVFWTLCVLLAASLTWLMRRARLL